MYFKLISKKKRSLFKNKNVVRFKKKTIQISREEAPIVGSNSVCHTFIRPTLNKKFKLYHLHTNRMIQQVRYTCMVVNNLSFVTIAMLYIILKCLKNRPGKYNKSTDLRTNVRYIVISQPNHHSQFFIFNFLIIIYKTIYQIFKLHLNLNLKSYYSHTNNLKKKHLIYKKCPLRYDNSEIDIG
ncbi:hypothetical protein AGLY_000243 [Aphis glycines]|uniref:Uncharacterized protein n=1 Tax=Aphis glycines TaxID=307491 RepID=A0A6G0U6F1_APHGL|nr:hypothetical protein AGLY_000243 [Aphis glycines]